MSQLNRFFRNNLFMVLLAPVGALLGFAYWHFIGCNTGTCNITSVWYNSTAYGLVLGALVGNFIGDYFKPKKTNPN